jgi:hypothetical protein
MTRVGLGHFFNLFILPGGHLMNISVNKVISVVLGCLVSLLCACASSNLVDIWHDPSFKASPLSKMLVIAVSKNESKRRIWEDAFVSELTNNGVATTPSYSLFPDAPPDSDQILASVQEHGFDGILVILRLPTETDRQYIPGYMTYTEQNIGYNSYWHRYRTYYREIDHPGYVDSQTVAIKAIDVTTTGDHGRLIWSARSRTPDPASVNDVQDGIADLVIPDLVQRHIIAPKK